MLEPADTRSRLIRAMLHALATRGYHGVGVNDVLAVAGAPKGVLYHHFPGGKAALAEAAIVEAALITSARVERLTQPPATLPDAIGKWLEYEIKHLTDSDFELGCPFATIALETTADDVALRAAIARAFALVRAALERAITAHAPTADTQALSALIVATYEGSLMQARVAHDAAPLHAASRALQRVLKGL